MNILLVENLNNDVHVYNIGHNNPANPPDVMDAAGATDIAN